MDFSTQGGAHNTSFQQEIQDWSKGKNVKTFA